MVKGRTGRKEGDIAIVARPDRARTSRGRRRCHGQPAWIQSDELSSRGRAGLLRERAARTLSILSARQGLRPAGSLLLWVDLPHENAPAPPPGSVPGSCAPPPLLPRCPPPRVHPRAGPLHVCGGGLRHVQRLQSPDPSGLSVPHPARVPTREAGSAG